ncbi:MAG: response regulator [Spirochaetales bacterium]|nr:response regulator [Spirochaetales bacterium]
MARKKFICCILVLLGLASSVLCAEGKQPLVRAGFLDLSDYDPEGNVIIKLDGEWEFYWDRLLLPGDFSRDPKPARTGFIQVPGGWTKFKGPVEIPGYGVATYRLRVKLNPELRLFSIKIPEVLTAYNLWINDTRVAAVGIVSRDREKARAGFNHHTVSSINGSGTIDIILQVSNFDDLWGGITNSITLGKQDIILMENEKSLFFDFALFGSIFIFAVYHFGLFLFRKKDYSTLLFALFCLIIASRTLMTGVGFIIPFYPPYFWEIGKKIGHLTVAMGPPVFLFFIFYQFPKDMYKPVVMGSLGAGLILSLIIIITPFRFFVHLLIIGQTALAANALYIVFTLVIAIKRRREGAVLSLTGFSIFFMLVVNDMLYVFDVLHTGIYSHIGLFGFILAYSFILAIRFSRLFQKVTLLSRELQVYSNDLEIKVKQRTAQLQEANEQKTNFFINLAHETKTPITIISNYLEQDIRKRGMSEEIRIMEQNLYKLKNDIHNFLDIEKLHKGQVFYDHNMVVDLSRIIREKVLLFKEITDKKTISLHENIGDKLFAKMDPAALDRIVNNLLDNAIKFTGPAGRITVSLKQVSDTLIFSVKDTGMGMDQEKVKNIFEPYYQISRKKRNIEGIGVGLSIVKKIIDDVKGTVAVHSEPEKGTEIVISLPAHHPASADAPVNEITSPEPPNKPVWIQLKPENYRPDQYSLLVVEDNMYMLYYLQLNLMDDYNVFYAKNGSQALKKIRSIPKPDMIISDIMMDTMDGYEFYKTLLQLEMYAYIPFIFLTAKFHPDTMLKGLAMGAVDFIQKPFSIIELKAKLASHLQIKHAQYESNIHEMENKISLALRSLEAENRARCFKFNSICHEHHITPREKEIIELLVQGDEYREIASALHISLNTIKPYIRNIYRKLNVESKYELVTLVNSSMLSLFSNEEEMNN